MNSRRDTVISGLTLAVISGCTTRHSRDIEDPYVISHATWWNFYKRGCVYLEDGEYLKAQSDFETALGIRKGARYPNKTDRFKARTYNMNIVENYYPNRELGITLYYLGQRAEALKFLNKSLAMEPTGRTQQYIDILSGNTP